MKRILLTLFVLPMLVACSERVALDNGKLRLEFDRTTATLVSMVDKTSGYEFIDSTATPAPLWEVVPLVEGEQFELPTEVKVTKLSSRKVRLAWRQASGEGMELTATVRLDKHKALSYWNVELRNYDGEKVKELNYPCLNNIKEIPDECVVTSNWTGRMHTTPRKHYKTISMVKQNRPTMQFSALYGSGASGLYVATNDKESYGKSFHYIFHDALTDYKMVNILEMEDDANSYCPPYDFILGAFQGDWYDAAQIYREWALQQEWAKNCRLHSGKMNPWLPKTALWMWNRGRSNNVLKEAIDLQEYVGLPVSVLWHWWHNGPYDDAFPEYLPPREGRESFVKAVAEAKAKGVNMTPYMNSIQWGESRKSWKELNIEQYVARKADGSTHAHAYNAFTKNPITPMCMSQEFWREKYSDLCDTVVNDYGCTGVYMDQACLHYWCYNKNHGHSVGGGNYWVKGYLKLVERIREKTSEANPVLTGEGSGEDWMAHLDGFLTLEASRERMSGLSRSSVIPLFNAVYHGYAICFGNFGGFTYPPYDEFWPEKYRSPLSETLLPATFNKQLCMEQARTFVWGTQPMIVNYHSFVREHRPQEIAYVARLARLRYAALEYLQDGKMMRTPKIDSPIEEIDIAKMSTYGGAKGNGQTVFPFKKRVPVLYAGAWQSAEGNVAVALTNIADQEEVVRFNLAAEEYELPCSGEIYKLDENGRALYGSWSDGKIDIELPLASREAVILEFKR